MTQPGDAAILAQLDFAPTCTIVVARRAWGRAHPITTTPCAQPAIGILGAHDCATASLARTPVCAEHAAMLGEIAIHAVIEIRPNPYRKASTGNYERRSRHPCAHSRVSVVPTAVNGGADTPGW